MMRTGQTNLLLFLCLIFIKACLANDDIITSEPVRARIGQSVSLSCEVTGNVSVTLSEWTRCNDSSSIAVFHPKHKDELSPHIKEPYRGHVSITEYHTLTINQLQDRDFGEYCCKVTTFPKGSLVGRVYLLKDESSPPAGLPVMTILYITCGVVGLVILTGIITLLVCSEKRKMRIPVHVIVSHTSLSPKQPSLLQKDSHTPSHTPRHDEEDDDDMYLSMKNTEP